MDRCILRLLQSTFQTTFYATLPALWHRQLQTPPENVPYDSLTFNRGEVFSGQKGVEYHLEMDRESEVLVSDKHRRYRLNQACLVLLE